jgi:glutathione synthase
MQASVNIFLLFYRPPSAVVLMVVQPEERNMYDQYWLVSHLKESYPFLCLLPCHSYRQSLSLKRSS